MLDAALRAWKEIDLDALAHNAQVLQKLLPSGCELMAVVKADAYGHGAIPVARRLEQEGVHAFAVACLSEGIALRRAGIGGDILILGYTPPQAVPQLRRWNLIQTVADEEHGRALDAAGQTIRVHLALDTGMHRLGVPAEDIKALSRLYKLEHLNICGLFSHLCVSDGLGLEEQAYTQNQLRQFYSAVRRLSRGGYDPGKVHIQASYGLLNLPSQPCDYVRAGIALYGVYSDGQPTRLRPELRPVLSLRARVASVRALAAGERVGYGLAFQAERDCCLAVVSIGYADGLPRELPQRGGRVLINSQFCPMVGRMCMDQLLVDVTEISDVQAGSIVTLIGRDSTLRIQVEELARRCDTITNELLSRLGGRLGQVIQQC